MKPPNTYEDSPCQETKLSSMLKKRTNQIANQLSRSPAIGLVPRLEFPFCGNGRTCLHQTPIEARPALAEASAGCQPDKRDGGTRNSSVSLLPSYSKRW